MNPLKSEIKKQTAGFITAALGLVAGLAWNDAIRALIDSFFPAGSDLAAKFIYAAGVTVLVVFLVIQINKFFREQTDQPE